MNQLPTLAKKKKWPHGIAGREMITRVPLIYTSYTIGEAEKLITKNIHNYDTINYIYVVDDKNKLIGVFSIKELFRKDPNTPIPSILRKTLIKVKPTTSSVKAAHTAIQNNIKSIPVTDSKKTLLGVVPSDAIHRILRDDFADLTGQIAGIGEESPENSFKNILDHSIQYVYIQRIPWLLFGMLGGILLARLIGLFENTLQENLLLVGFIPVISYISNAVAIQVQILFIRDISFNADLPLKKYVAKSLLVSFFIAITSALVLIFSALFGWADPNTLFIVGIAMIIAIMFAVCLSLAIPYVLQKLKVDPGIASGPFSTIIQDFSSILIFFFITSLFL